MKSDKGKEMLTFTDWYYQDSKIMQSILDTQGIEIDAIRDKIKNILEQFYVACVFAVDARQDVVHRHPL